uniref:Dimethylargininase n=1 Tax=Plectus sambesii TaxID=2011161 RepID=A0A914V658_9BILA
MAKRILMCPPKYFKVEYAINPWMDTHNKVDVPRAQSQWNELKKTLERAGAKVEVMDPTVSEREASKFACNSVAVGKNVVMPAGNDETAKALTDRGYNVHFVDMSEFIKSGGASKCCTLAI